MDLIVIRNLVFSGTHGVQPQEKKKPQRFLVNIEARLDTAPAAVSDRLEDTVDYAPLREIARHVIEKESHNLIERIAQRIAGRILHDVRIVSVVVRIDKPDIWENGTPSISIERFQ
jgi:7,8-dihydroneopterin aldolase/epimerase/oxygenase